MQLTHYSPATMGKHLFSMVGWLVLRPLLNALIGLCPTLQHDKDFIESSVKDSEVVQVRTGICKLIFSVYPYGKPNF